MSKEELRLANDEIAHLAKVAERERIARDLHDVLGHTLSLITLKSELARKLVDRDPERAKLEMQDVETTSRAALADVREAIRGYRSDGFFAELSRARAALETAGVTLQSSTVALELSPAQESVLAMVLREAATNVVRHAEAQRCEVRLLKQDSLCRLEIADDGCGCDAPEGNGLRGMCRRCSIGGSLERLTGKGTGLVIQLPIKRLATATGRKTDSALHEWVMSGHGVSRADICADDSGFSACQPFPQRLKPKSIMLRLRPV